MGVGAGPLKHHDELKNASDFDVEDADALAGAAVAVTIVARYGVATG